MVELRFWQIIVENIYWKLVRNWQMIRVLVIRNNLSNLDLWSNFVQTANIMQQNCSTWEVVKTVKTTQIKTNPNHLFDLARSQKRKSNLDWTMENKAFVGLGSCDNAQTERFNVSRFILLYQFIVTWVILLYASSLWIDLSYCTRIIVTRVILLY